VRLHVRAMARNAGESEDLIIEKILASEENDCYDFLSRKMTNAYEAGIIDPKKVTRCALENAASAAGILLTTSHAIVKSLKLFSVESNLRRNEHD
jgi:chaperonin GroEL